MKRRWDGLNRQWSERRFATGVTTVLWLSVAVLALPALAQEEPAPGPRKGVFAWINPAGGSWHNPANWNQGMVPSSTDSITIDGLGSSASYTVTVNAGAQASTVTLGDGLGGVQELLVDGNLVALDAFNGMTINNGGLLSIENGADVQSQNSSQATNGGQIVLINARAQIDIFNNMEIFAKGNSQLEGNIVNIGKIVVEGTATHGNALLTITSPSGLLNDFTIELTSLGGVANATINVPNGLFNGSTGTIDVLPGAGGARMIQAQLSNDGQMNIQADLQLNQPNATHNNNGFITVFDTLFQIQQSPTGSFTNNVSIDLQNIGTIQVDNGNFDPAFGTIMGAIAMTKAPPIAPTIALNGVTIVNNNLTNDNDLEMFNCVLDMTATLTNNGNVRAFGLNTMNGTFNNFGVTVIEGLPGPINANLVFPVPFTNNGTIDLASSDPAANAALTVSAPPFMNDGMVFVTPGMGGQRRLQASLVNNGTIQIDHPLLMDFPGGTAHVNNMGGRIDVNANFTVDMTPAFPYSFINNGPLQISLGQTMTLQGGDFDPGTGQIADFIPKRGPGAFLVLDGVNIINNTFVNTITTTLINATVAAGAGVDNQGDMILHGVTNVTGTIGNGTGGIMRNEGMNPFGAADLLIIGSFQNDGEFRLDSPGSANNATIGATTITNGPSGNFVVNAGGGGSRAINASLINQGSLDAGAQLDISTGTHTNPGVMLANLGDIIMNLTGGGSFDNTGNIQIGNGRTIEISNGNFSSTGTIDAPALNAFLNLNSAQFTAGTLNVPAGMTLNFVNTGSTGGSSIANNGDMIVKGVCNLAGTFDNPTGNLSVTGDSVVGNANMVTANGFTNGGTVTMTTNTNAHTSRLEWQAGTFDNFGPFEFAAGAGGADRETVGNWNQQGTGTVTVNHPTQMRGPNMIHANLGLIDILGGNLTIADSATGPTVFNNNGLVRVGLGRTLFLSNATFQNNSGLPAGVVEGNGTIDATAGIFNNDNLVTPGLSPGSIQVQGGMNQTANGSILIEIDGDTPVTGFDVLNVSGNLNRDGILDIQFINGFTPNPGDTFQVLNYGSATGFFQAILGDGQPIGSGFVQVDVNPNDVTVTILPTQSFWDNPAGGLWTNAANWSPPIVPSSISEVFIDLDGNYTVTLNANVEIQRFELGAAMGAQRLLIQNGSLSTQTGPNVIQTNGILELDDSDMVDPFIGGQKRGVPPSISNDGQMLISGVNSVQMGLDNTANGTININGNVGPEDSVLTLYFGMNNAGAIAMDSADPAAAAVLESMSGIIDNQGSIFTIQGSGGGRDIISDVLNRPGGLLRLQASASQTGGSSFNVPPLPGLPAKRPVSQPDNENDGAPELNTAAPVGKTFASSVDSIESAIPLTDIAQPENKRPVGSIANQGTVEIHNNAVFTMNNSDLLNQATGLVLGNGFFGIPNGVFNNDGALTPGTVATGILATDTNTTMAPGSSFNVEIAGLIAGAQYDQFNTSGDLFLDGTLNVQLVAPFLPAIGDSFVLATAANITGTFFATNIPFFAADREFQLNIGATAITLDVVAIPGGGNPGEFSFSFGAITVNEDVGNIQLSVERLNGTTGPVGVNVFTANGSAFSGSDFSPINGNLQFADGEGGTKSFIVEILDSPEDEGPESFTVNLGNPTGGATLGALTQVVVNIRDNDDARLSWEFANVNRREGDTDVRAEEEFTIRAVLSAPTSRTVIVPVTVGGSATPGLDFQSLTNRLEIPAGETSADYNLLILGDDLHESDETIELTMGQGNIPTIAPTVFTLTIFDNEPTPTVTWFGAPNTIYEGFGAKTDAEIAFAAKLSHVSEIELTAPYTVGGTSTPGQDHNLEAGTLVFPPGEEFQPISFTLFDDDEAELPESVFVQFQEGGGAVPGTPRTKTIRIEDNDTPRIMWTEARQTVIEDDTGAKSQAVSVTARITQPFPVPLTIPYAVGGNATLGSDHDLVPGELAFAAGETESVLTFNVLGDVQQEAVEAIVITLLEDNVLPGIPFKHLVVIQDNDENQAPDTAIVSPDDRSRWRVDEVIPFAAEGSDPQGDALSFSWELCRSAGGCITAEGQSLAGISFPEPGIYVITCWARDSAGNEDQTPAQITIRVVPRIGPTISIIEPVERPSRITQGTTLNFRAEVNAPDSENPLIEWFLLSEPDDVQNGDTASFSFPDTGIFRVIARVTDETGAIGTDGVEVRVGADEVPPALRIVAPGPGESFAVGQPIDWLGEILSTPVKSKSLNVFWELGDGRRLTGLDPEPLSYPRPGRYFVRLFAVDEEIGLFLRDQRTIFIRGGSDDEPIVNLNLPTDLRVPPPTTSKRQDAGEVFFSAVNLNTQGFRQLQYFWDFGNGVTRREAVPGRIRYETPGVYTVTMYAVTPAGVQSEVVTRNIVVAASDDRDFEPNEIMAQAPTLTPGIYENLLLDESSNVDIYKVEIPEDGQRLSLTLNSDDFVIVRVRDSAENVVREETAAGASSIQIQGLNAGDYFVELEPAATAKRNTISYSFDVLVLAPALFYPDVIEDAANTTALGLVNTTNQIACVELVGYDGGGEIVATAQLELPPKGRADQGVAQLFEDFAGEVAWVQANSDRELTGYSRTASGDGQELYALTAGKQLNDELFVPHIAEQTEQWFTRASVVNGTDQSLTSSIVTPGSLEDLNLQTGFAVDKVDFQARFGGSITDEDDWARFVEETAQAALAGAEVFGTKDGTRIVAGLELANVRSDNPNFTFVGNNLYFVHVARDVENFFTGVALVNAGEAEQSYTVRAYGTGGAEFENTKTITLAGNEKRVEVAETFLEGIASPADVDWFVVEADSDIVGFELFGTRNGKQLAGLEATTALRPDLCYPFLSDDPGFIHGISVVNVNATTINVRFTLFDDEGGIIAEMDRNLAPFEKFSETIRNIFSDVSIPAGTSGWLSVNADLPLAGFELFINGNTGEQMGAVIAQ